MKKLMGSKKEAENMEFRDLKKQYQVLKYQIDKAMIEVAQSGAYIMGKPVYELESSLAEYVGVKHCITCANGTDALMLALMAWNIGEGDAVFVPDFTFFATAEVASLVGATPVFVDVDPDTFNMDPAKLESTINTILSRGSLRPKVVIPVDLFGLPANHHEIRAIAEKYGLHVLEDGAQGFGGSINGKKACGFGDISATSFFPAKPLGCYGDGGALFTDNDEWARLINSIKVHGKGTSKYDNVRIGINSRLDTLQAAILQPKFEAFKNYELEQVNKTAALYSENLNGLVKTPVIPEGYYSSWAQYTIVLKDREQRNGLQAYLKENGIPSMIYYQKPLHRQEVYRHMDHAEGDFSVSEILCDRVLSLPISPYITEKEISFICKNIRKFMLN